MKLYAITDKYINYINAMDSKVLVSLSDIIPYKINKNNKEMKKMINKIKFLLNSKN